MRVVSLRRVVLLTTVVLAAAAASFIASPASAGTPAWSLTCGVSTQFRSLDRLAFTSTARGETAREPGINQTVENPGAQQGRGRSFSVSAPVYVHVVSPDGVIGNVSNRIIRDQISVLNATFGGLEGGYATGLDFTLAGITRTVNATTPASATTSGR